MLALAVARHAPRDQALSALENVFDELPGHAAIALAEIGGPEQAALLRTKLEQATGWVADEIRKAMRKIEACVSP